MGLGKVILAIFALLIILVGIVAVDGYLTYKTFSDMSSADIDNLVSDPQFSVSGSNSEIVTVSVNVDLPSAGFIPKGVIIKLIVDFNGDKQSDEKTINLGESKTFSLQFTMTASNAQTLANGGSISVSADAEVTPIVFNFAISQAKQDVDLGSQTVTA